MLALSYYLGWDTWWVGHEYPGDQCGFSAAVTNPFTIGVRATCRAAALFWSLVEAHYLGVMYAIFALFLVGYAAVWSVIHKSRGYAEETAERARYQTLDMARLRPEPLWVRAALVHGLYCVVPGGAPGCSIYSGAIAGCFAAIGGAISMRWMGAGRLAGVSWKPWEQPLGRCAGYRARNYLDSDGSEHQTTLWSTVASWIPCCMVRRVLCWTLVLWCGAVDLCNGIIH
jgi:hypothetical protein